MPLPIIQTQNQQFAQELAAYRNATAMGMAEPELLQTNQPWEEFKNSAFQEYVRNQLDNTTTIARTHEKAPIAVYVANRGMHGFTVYLVICLDLIYYAFCGILFI